MHEVSYEPIEQLLVFMELRASETHLAGNVVTFHSEYARKVRSRMLLQMLPNSLLKGSRACPAFG
jgi:hypothetical protein